MKTLIFSLLLIVSVNSFALNFSKLSKNDKVKKANTTINVAEGIGFTGFILLAITETACPLIGLGVMIGCEIAKPIVKNKIQKPKRSKCQ